MGSIWYSYGNQAKIYVLAFIFFTKYFDGFGYSKRPDNSYALYNYRIGWLDKHRNSG